MKKQRNKKYNPRLKQLQRVLITLKNKSFVHTSLDNDVICFHNTRPQIYLPDQKLVSVLATERFKWSTFMAVFFKDSFGKINMKSDSRFIKEPLKQNEVADYLSAAHSDLIHSVNHKFFYGYGWLSCPFEYDWTEEDAFQIFAYTGITNPDQFTKGIPNVSIEPRVTAQVA
jgi:hypothetical protein